MVGLGIALEWRDRGEVVLEEISSYKQEAVKTVTVKCCLLCLTQFNVSFRLIILESIVPEL